MTVIFEQKQISAKAYPVAQQQREQIKQELRQKIHLALQVAKDLSPDNCRQEIKDRLLAIQNDCEAIAKSFIVVEEKITCDQYGLGGCNDDAAILFRGPSITASVAICVTSKGSLLHRNGCFWKIYRDAGDIHLEGYK